MLTIVPTGLAALVAPVFTAIAVIAAIVVVARVLIVRAIALVVLLLLSLLGTVTLRSGRADGERTGKRQHRDSGE
ncbi:MAG: hypothetical protein IPL62_03810 [Caulobacteraceae bacterium]|nr:hypothetical protein [Caulobacteraceae bacterium]